MTTFALKGVEGVVGEPIVHGTMVLAPNDLMPAQPLIRYVAVTRDRVLLLSLTSLRRRAKEVVREAPRSSVTGASLVEGGRLANPLLRIQFADGTDWGTIHVPRAQRKARPAAEELVAALTP